MTPMTRQHFRLIAAAFAEAREAAEELDPGARADFIGGIEAAQKRVAAVCKSFNPGFDGAKFHEACAIES